MEKSTAAIIKTKNSILHRSGSKSKVVLCKKCRRIISYINIGNTERFTLSFVCKCGSLGRVDVNPFRNGKAPNGAILYNRDNRFSCSKCHEELFSIEDDSVRGYAFRIKCGCGRIYDKRMNLPDRSRSLGRFAISDD